MDGVQIVFIITLIIGFFGTIIPMVPGMGLIFGAILLYGFYDSWTLYSPVFAVVAGICTVIAFAIDYLAQALGAKKFGASNRGVIGSLVGGIIGLMLFNFVGLLLGAIIGLVAVEYYEKGDLAQSGKAAFGVLVGSLIGIILQAVIAVSLIAYVFMKMIF